MAWGFNWVAARIILEALQPWALRTIGIGLGTLTLFAAAAISGVPLSIPRGERLKVVIAGFFNVAVFGVGSAYAQVYGTTSRAIVIAYSMPIWAALLARLVLKEKLNAVKLAALALMRHRTDHPDLAAGAHRLSVRRVVGARLRLELGGRHDLSEMGEDRGADLDGGRMAIAVRLADAGRRHAAVRRPAASVAAAAARAGAGSATTALSAWGWPISSGS